MTEDSKEHVTYRGVGVDDDAAAAGLGGLLGWVNRTLALREGLGEPLLPIGFFANALRLTDRLSLVVSTDGVGTKVVVAQLMGEYGTIGIDCVAVNVNDIVCTGAEPVALVDYISVQAPHREMLTGIGKGLYEGAQRAGVAIVGGELSQHPDTLTGPREGYAFDLVGTALGVLEGREPVTGRGIRPGDVVLGLASDGIHSNGLTLARRVLLDAAGGRGIERHLPECGRTVGEELLRPTHIYVPEILALLRAGVEVKGLAHISGGGLLNLSRLDADVAYRITSLPEAPPIFGVVQAQGGVETAEMFHVFNMGVGFCAVVAAQDSDAALSAIRDAGGVAQPIGEVVEGPERRVVIEPHGLVGQAGRFEQAAP